MSNSNNEEVTTMSSGYIQQPLGYIHHFYVSGEIGQPQDYSEWIQTIRSAGPMDVIYLHLNSEGGDVMTTIQLMRALNESEAKVISSAEGLVASAATMLFLCGDQCEISDHSMFMFHTFSSFSYGKSSEMQAQVKLEASWGANLVRQIYDGFLTEVEILAILDGRDHWMEADEVLERLKNKKEEVNQAPISPKKRKKSPNKAK
jgi:ATP-dependent protease ClpP protease subunit|tara:strand:+ start:1775 stop:2383 length:609 start_codon:yes stop_codon:yes gene_type:complete